MQSSAVVPSSTKHNTVVVKSTHFYWNLASVRLVVPGVWKDEQVFQAIEPGFSQYPSESFELVIGKATAVDPSAKTAKVALNSSTSSSTGGAAGEERSISYDYLVLATGSRSADPAMPWKLSVPYEQALQTVHSVAHKIKAARHIVIAGAGPTGVELAGEIRFEFKDKTVVLLSADEALAGGDSTAGSLEKELGKLGVEIKKGVRATGEEARPDGKTEVKVSEGDNIVTDLYLPTVGLVANTEYLPSECLKESKYVDVDDQLRVRGAKDTWALGDIISRPRAAYVNSEPQVSSIPAWILSLPGKRTNSM
jgi:NADH dehydrogenase FAD-containing subunit